MAITWNVVLRLGFVAALLAVMQARAASVQIEIDTASLGLKDGNWDLAFDFVDGDGDPQSNLATISGFAITGGSLTRPSPYPILSGDATGDLSTAPPLVILRDSAFSEYLDNAKLGSLLTFVLEITENTVPGLTPDAFSFLILDPTTGLSPFETSDLTGANALFLYSIGNENQPTVFFCRDVTDAEIDCVTATPIAAVPEPGALALALAGLLALGALRTPRRFPLRG